MDLQWGLARTQHTGSQSYRDSYQRWGCGVSHMEAKSTMAGESSHIRVAAKFVSLRLKYTKQANRNQYQAPTKH